jgi:hypothetical protein
VSRFLAALLVVAACDEGTVAPPDPLDAGGGGVDAGAKDAGIERPDPSRPDNDRRDSDCDGLSDADEYGTVWASGGRTDPGDPDSDDDGLPDGLEAGRTISVACSTYIGDGDPGSKTDPTNPDTDGDGLLDGDEDANQDGVYQRTQETNPRHPDSDGDGLCDGPNTVTPICTGGDPTPIPGGSDADGDGVADDLDRAPNDPDSDDDRLCDGPATIAGTCESGEDLDADGAVGPGESDPFDVDTDCDGLTDGPSYDAFLGERMFGTDPTKPDTDGDGLSDGLEVGVTSPPVMGCPGFAPDADPSSTTDPASADTDGDGIPDGAEDTNQNGAVDPGELDPRNGADGATDPTIGQACGLTNLVQVDRPRAYSPDLQVATANRGIDRFSEVAEILDGTRVVGIAAFNPDAGIAYVALSVAPIGADPLAEEQARRNVLDGIGAITQPITTGFTTWDGFEAVHAAYHMEGDTGVKARIGAITEALVPGATGLLSNANDRIAQGGFDVEVEIIRRSTMRSVVLIALLPNPVQDEKATFTLADLARGAAVAQHPDEVGLQCDRFVTEGFTTVDILWAIDTSVSMSDEQLAVAASAAGMRARLGGATIDWRAAVVHSAFYAPRTANMCTNQSCGETYEEQCRPFTRDLDQFSRWLTEGDPSWIGAGGPCNVPDERIAHGARLILSDPAMGTVTLMPPSAVEDPMRLRASTNLLLILMGDADDQHYADADVPMGIDAYEAFFRALPVAAVKLGGILCPIGETCGETQRNPRAARGLVNRFNGVIGSIRDVPSIEATVAAIIDDAIGSFSPYVLSRDAIPSTIKVAMEAGSTVGACPVADVPRSRVHGFDYDPRSRAIAFFGDCRPDPNNTGKRVSVSYRFWIDLSDDPNGGPCGICADCPGLTTCDPVACTCACEQTLTCSAGFVWDGGACDCVCDGAALACPATHEADLDLCACTCRPDCGGCAPAEVCHPSLCACQMLGL